MNMRGTEIPVPGIDHKILVCVLNSYGQALYSSLVETGESKPTHLKCY